ncbi:MAG: AbrB/MazE/SpoVT family DNA-binding domain-containing protein [Dehalococcoidia bacterium]|nr:AbrB/MazE/SpoVT family DNA-binding domain-containing protein [Dehalococcoidia bacterium]
MRFVRTITTKGQVTVPAGIRKKFGLKPHDKLAFRVDDKGVHLEPAESSVMASYGVAKLAKGFKDVKQLRRETKEWVADRALREM